MRERLLRDQRGVAAIEFGILAPIFFLMLLALIDLSIYFATNSIVHDAMETAARAVRVGRLQSGSTANDFRTVLCQRLFFVSCGNFTFSVKPTANLAAPGLRTPGFDTSGHLVDQTYSPGNADDIVVVTIAYVHTFIVPYIGLLFGDSGLSDPHLRTIVAFVVVKNEPYQ
ncbi:MAG: TadE/TadG family type IV pilus assembly protein [Alphaproteobacteria bacterium]